MESRTRVNHSTVIFLFGLLIAELVIFPMRVRGNNAEFSIEGLGCDSCGKDCSAVCGSRQFRSCCFNYIKKRSGPGTHHSSPHPNVNSNANNNLLFPSTFGAMDLDSSAGNLGPNERQKKVGRMDSSQNQNQNPNHNRGEGGSSDRQQQQREDEPQQLFSTSFPGNSLRNLGKNLGWNSRVYVVTETEIPDRLIRRYLSSQTSSSSPSGSFDFGTSSSGGSGSESRLMRNRLLPTSSASAQSSNWISIPNEIDKSLNMFEH